MEQRNRVAVVSDCRTATSPIDRYPSGIVSGAVRIVDPDIVEHGAVSRKRIAIAESVDFEDAAECGSHLIRRWVKQRGRDPSGHVVCEDPPRAQSARTISLLFHHTVQQISHADAYRS